MEQGKFSVFRAGVQTTMSMHIIASLSPNLFGTSNLDNLASMTSHFGILYPLYTGTFVDVTLRHRLVPSLNLHACGKVIKYCVGYWRAPPSGNDASSATVSIEGINGATSRNDRMTFLSPDKNWNHHPISYFSLFVLSFLLSSFYFAFSLQDNEHFTPISTAFSVLALTSSSSLSVVPNSKYRTWDCAAEIRLTTPGPWPKLWGGSPRRPSILQTCLYTDSTARTLARSTLTTPRWPKTCQQLRLWTQKNRKQDERIEEEEKDEEKRKGKRKSRRSRRRWTRKRTEKKICSFKKSIN